MDKETALREIHKRFQHWLDGQIMNWDGKIKERLDTLTDVSQAYSEITHHLVLEMREDSRQELQEPPVGEPVTTCICITHNNERYFHPQCTSFHNVTAVGYVGGIPYKTQLFQGAWPHGTLVETYDDRCTQCKEFDNDGCPNCGPNTIRKVFDPDEDIGPCPYEDKLCPKCKLELKASPSGWSCINGHGY